MRKRKESDSLRTDGFQRWGNGGVKRGHCTLPLAVELTGQERWSAGAAAVQCQLQWVPGIGYQLECPPQDRPGGSVPVPALPSQWPTPATAAAYFSSPRPRLS